LATKSTHKRKNFNKKQIAAKLDKLAERVSSKDIFVVSRNQEYYTVVDYKTEKITYNHLPNRQVANKICSRMNKKQLSKVVVKEIYTLLDKYYMLENDTYFFKNTISNTTSDITLHTAYARLDLTLARMNNIIDKILTKC